MLDPPSQNSFVLFVVSARLARLWRILADPTPRSQSAWTLLALVYVTLVPAFLSRAANRYAIIVLEALTLFFWIAGTAALGVFVGRLNLSICKKQCVPIRDAFRVETAFAGLECILWAVTSVLAVLEIKKSGRQGWSSIDRGRLLVQMLM